MASVGAVGVMSGILSRWRACVAEFKVVLGDSGSEGTRHRARSRERGRYVRRYRVIRGRPTRQAPGQDRNLGRVISYPRRRARASMICCTIMALGPTSDGSNISALRLSRLACPHNGLNWMVKTKHNYN